MSIEDTLASAPLGVDIEHRGGRIYERVRRETVGSRRYAPCDNSWVAVDRIVHAGRTCFLFHRAHDCFGSDALRRDLIERDLGALGFAARAELREHDGQIDVITDDCPGVRLRALVEASQLRGESLSREIAWHIVRRTAALVEVWRRVGVEPKDTFVGFDGSLHLFPSMPACWDAEMPSFTSEERFDPLVVDGSREQLAQLLCAVPPPPVFAPSEAHVRELLELAQHPDPTPRRFAEAQLARHAERQASVDPVVDAFLAEPPAAVDATRSLAELTRDCFPRTHARHRHIYASLGRDLDGDGLAREASTLARS